MKEKVIELQEEIEKSTITVRDFNTFHSVTDRISRMKIITNIKDFNDTIKLT